MASCRVTRKSKLDNFNAQSNDALKAVDNSLYNQEVSDAVTSYKLTEDSVFNNEDYFTNRAKEFVEKALNKRGEDLYILGDNESALASTVQSNYEKAMSKGSDYIGNVFKAIFYRKRAVYKPNKDDNSVLVGRLIDDVFIVSHFAPETMRKGVELLKTALNSKMPVVFPVTDNLVPMLEKVGFTKQDTITQPFAGELVTKTVMGNKAFKLKDKIKLKALAFAHKVKGKTKLEERKSKHPELNGAQLRTIANNLSKYLGVPVVYYSDYTDKKRAYWDMDNKAVYFNTAHSQYLSTPFHEFMHPIVNEIFKSNPELYSNLLKSVKENSPEVLEAAYKTYSDYREDSFKDDEALVHILTELVLDPSRITLFKHQGTRNILLRLLDKIKEFLQTHFYNNTYKDKVYVLSLSPTTTLGELADLFVSERIIINEPHRKFAQSTKIKVDPDVIDRHAYVETSSEAKTLSDRSLIKYIKEDILRELHLLIEKGYSSHTVSRLETYSKGLTIHKGSLVQVPIDDQKSVNTLDFNEGQVNFNDGSIFKITDKEKFLKDLKTKYPNLTEEELGKTGVFNVSVFLYKLERDYTESEPKVLEKELSSLLEEFGSTLTTVEEAYKLSGLEDVVNRKLLQSEAVNRELQQNVKMPTQYDAYESAAVRAKELHFTPIHIKGWYGAADSSIKDHLQSILSLLDNEDKAPYIELSATDRIGIDNEFRATNPYVEIVFNDDTLITHKNSFDNSSGIDPETNLRFTRSGNEPTQNLLKRRPQDQGKLEVFANLTPGAIKELRVDTSSYKASSELQELLETFNLLLDKLHKKKSSKVSIKELKALLTLIFELNSSINTDDDIEIFRGENISIYHDFASEGLYILGMNSDGDNFNIPLYIESLKEPAPDGLGPNDTLTNVDNIEDIINTKNAVFLLENTLKNDKNFTVDFFTSFQDYFNSLKKDVEKDPAKVLSEEYGIDIKNTKGEILHKGNPQAKYKHQLLEQRDLDQESDVEEVLAPNGEESILFQDIEGYIRKNPDHPSVQFYKDIVKERGKNEEDPREVALAVWAQAYTEEFANWFGDWQNNPEAYKNNLDYNGEPKILFLKSLEGLRQDFTSKESEEEYEEIDDLERAKDVVTESIEDTYGEMTNINQVLDRLKKYAKAPYIRQLAAQLRVLNLSNAKFKLETQQEVRAEAAKGNLAVPGIVEYAGLYDPDTNTVSLNKESFYDIKDAERVIIHEILHAISWHTLNSNSIVKEEFESYFEEVKETLKKAGVDVDSYYALSNIDEFMVGIFTNKELMKTLKQFKGVKSGVNLWRRFIIWLSKTLKSEGTLLEEAMEQAIKVIEFTKDQAEASKVPIEAMQESGEFYQRLASPADPPPRKRSQKEMLNALEDVKNEKGYTLFEGKYISNDIINNTVATFTRVTERLKQAFKVNIKASEEAKKRGQFYGLQAERIPEAVHKGMSLSQALKYAREVVNNEGETVPPQYLLDDTPLKKIYEKSKKFFEEHSDSKFIFQYTVGSLNYKLAGTIDMLEIKKDGSIKIYDFKASRYSLGKAYNAKGERIRASRIRDYTAQLSMYAKMLEEEFDISTPDIEVVEIHWSGQSKEDSAKPTSAGILYNYYNEYDSGLIKFNQTYVDSLTQESTKDVLDDADSITSQHGRLIQKVKEYLVAQLEKRAEKARRQQSRTGVGISEQQKIKMVQLNNAIDNLSVVDGILYFIEHAYSEIIEAKDGRPNTIKDRVTQVQADLINGKISKEKALYELNYYREYAANYKDMLLDIHQNLTLNGEKSFEANHAADSPFAHLKQMLSALNDIEAIYQNQVNPLISSTLAAYADNIKHSDEVKKVKERKIEALDKINTKIKNGEGTRTLHRKRKSLIKEITELSSLGTATEESILEGLNRSSKDISWLTYMLTPTISIDDGPIALFAKRVKEVFETLRMQTYKKGREVALEFSKFKKVVGNVTNMSKAYDKMLNEIEIVYAETDDDGIYQIKTKKELHFVTEEDLQEFYQNRKKYYEAHNILRYRMASNREIAELATDFVLNNYTVRPIEEVEDILSVHKNMSTVEEYANYLQSYISMDSQLYNSRVRENMSDEQFIEIAEEILRSGTVAGYKERGIKASVTNPFITPIKRPNPKFNQLGEHKEFRDFLYGMYIKSQEVMDESIRPGSRVPSIRKSSLDRLTEGEMREMLSDAKSSFIPLEEDVELFGSSDKTIPAMYTWSMNADDVSRNLTASVFAFYKEALKYEQLELIEPEAKSLLSQIGDRKVETKRKSKLAKKLGLSTKEVIEGVESNSYKMLEGFIDKIFYGIRTVSNDSTKVTTPLGVLDLNKTVDNLISFAAHTQLGGWNPLLNMTNFLNGKLQSEVERIGGEFITPDASKWARFKWPQIEKDLLHDFGKDFPESYWGQMMNYFDPIQGDYEDKLGKRMGADKLRKAVTSDAWFLGQHISERGPIITNWLGLMRSTEVLDAEGNKSTLDRAFKIVDGIVEIDTNFKGVDGRSIEQVISSTRNLLHGMSKEIGGVYNNFDSPEAKRYAVGKLLLLYRSFIEPGVRRRYGKLRNDQEMSSIREGYHRTMYRLLMEDSKELLKIINPFSKEQSKYEAFEIANARKSAAEIAFLLGLMAIGSLMSKADWDEEKETAYPMYLVLRTQRELSFFINPQSITEVISSPTVAYSVIKKALKLYKQLLPWNIEEEYLRDEGIWEKGDNKALARLLQLFGVNGYSTEPSYALEVFQKIGI